MRFMPGAARVWLLGGLMLFMLIQTVHGQYVRRGNYRTEQQRRLQYDLDDWISYTKTRRFTWMAAGSHYLYISTLDGGILRYQIYDNTWDYPYTTSNGLPSNQVVKVLYNPDNSFLYAITPGDEAVFNPASQEWIRRSETDYWPYEIPQPDSQPGDINVKDRFFSRDGLKNLPIFFPNGRYTILGDWILQDNQTFEEFRIIGYLRDKYDRIWMPVRGFGIGVGDLFSQRADFYEIGLPDIAPRAAAFQGEDIWIGGIGKNRSGRVGIARWPADKIGWDYFRARFISHLQNDDVHDIEVDGDSVWFATELGVALYDVGNDRWKVFSVREGLVTFIVQDLAVMGEYLYAGTNQGISRIHRASGVVERIKDERFLNLSFNRLAVQGDTIWAATRLGIFRYAEGFDRWEFVPSRAAVSDLNITAIDAFDGEIWFASSGGIFVYYLRSDTWESFPQVAMEISGPYSDIKINSGGIWVATQSGLLKYNRELKFWRLFTTRDGLLNNRCRQILPDGDYIWIVTDAGLTQFYWNNPHRSDY